MWPLGMAATYAGPGPLSLAEDGRSRCAAGRIRTSYADSGVCKAARRCRYCSRGRARATSPRTTASTRSLARSLQARRSECPRFPRKAGQRGLAGRVPLLRRKQVSPSFGRVRARERATTLRTRPGVDSVKAQLSSSLVRADRGVVIFASVAPHDRASRTLNSGACTVDHCLARCDDQRG